MVTFNVYVILPEWVQRWRWPQTQGNKIMGNFQVHLSPYNLHHSLHFNPLLPLYPQIQWTGKEPALRNLNHLDKKHPETERFFHLPPCSCLQSGWQCRTQADADEGSIKERLCLPGSSSHLASTHTCRQAGSQMQRSDLPLPYHILADDPLLFNNGELRVSESYLHTSKGRKKTTQHDPETHSAIDPNSLRTEASPLLIPIWRKIYYIYLTDWNESHRQFLWLPVSHRDYVEETHIKPVFSVSLDHKDHLFCITTLGIWLMEDSQITKSENIPGVIWPENFSELISVWSRKKIQSWLKDFY